MGLTGQVLPMSTTGH